MAGNWIDNLKIALLENNVDEALKLSLNVPDDFGSMEELLEARELVSQNIDRLKERSEERRVGKECKSWFRTGWFA